MYTIRPFVKGGDATQTGHQWCDLCLTVSQGSLFAVPSKLCACARAHKLRDKCMHTRKHGERTQNTLDTNGAHRVMDAWIIIVYKTYVRCLKHFYVDKLVKFPNSSIF